jgi:molybdopterin-guanine dinucleotide biosynthesis protein MobB
VTGKPVVAFVSERSGTGKTTLLTAVLRCLKERGYRVGTVKHCGHGVSLDARDKDSGRHEEAGSEVTVVAGPGIMGSSRHMKEPSFAESIAKASKGTDMVLVEGFKDSSAPKIEVYRSGHSGTLMCRERAGFVKGIVAVASDVPLEVDAPLLPLNEPEKICDFIEKRFLLDRTD